MSASACIAAMVRQVQIESGDLAVPSEPDPTLMVRFDSLQAAVLAELQLVFSGTDSESWAALVGTSVAGSIWNRLAAEREEIAWT